MAHPFHIFTFEDALAGSYRAEFFERLHHPPLPPLGEDGLEAALEEGAGVLEVLFGVGFGGGETRKRFVEDTDDAVLLGEGGERDRDFLELTARQLFEGCASAERVQQLYNTAQIIIQKFIDELATGNQSFAPLICRHRLGVDDQMTYRCA